MNKELYVSSTPHETKVALMEDDQLAEVFFERENEYTLAGSIYKGRVTRVLPGMQSAFVDIGLERDAFLYVSDFLELTGDEEEDEEFGEIPAPRGAIDVSKPQPVEEAHSASTQTAFVEPDTEEESENFLEDFSTPADEQSVAGGDSEPASGDERESKKVLAAGVAAAVVVAAVAVPMSATPVRNQLRPKLRLRLSRIPAPPPRIEPRHESRPRSDYGPPPGYTPMVLPGESISKYRNLAPAAAESQPASSVDDAVVPAASVEDFPLPESNVAVHEEIEDEAAHLDQGFTDSEAEPEPVEAAPVVVEESQPRSRRGFWRSRRKPAVAVESEACRRRRAR